MMLGFSTNFFPLSHQNHQYSFRVLAALFSTKTLNPSSSPSNNSLYARIQIIRDPKISVVPVLEQWINEGRKVEKQQLQYLVRTLRDFRRFNHALEVSQWMTDRRYFTLSPSDIAARLELIHRVCGIEKADDYFNNVSNNLKTHQAYGALLRGYVQEKSVKKAEAIMQKMREMGMATTSFPYNMLINLYSQAREYDKIDILMQEMMRKGIPQDKFTMRNRMAAYVASSDISRMEGILNQMEEDPHFVIDWKVYSMAADGYLKAGSLENALKMLKKLEGMMPLQRRQLALQFLLSLYASTGNKNELYRVWNTYKPTNEPMDASYSCMITCLAKLDDVEGAEKIYEEWESKCAMYDFRVLNRLLAAYGQKGLLDKAESLVKKAVEGRTPYASTWSVLAMGYTQHNHMPKAVEMFKRALLVGRQGWTPNPIILAVCLDYLEQKRDMEGMEEIIKLLKNVGPLSRDIYHRLLRTCLAGGKSASEVLDQLKIDGFTADEETHKILVSRASL